MDQRSKILAGIFGVVVAYALLAGVVLATAIFYSFFFTQTRYRIPVEPQLVVLAALGMQRAFPRATAWLEGGGARAGPTRAET